MLHGTHLRALLESAGVPVTQHALSISVKLSRDTAQCVLEELLQHGYHVHANADTQQLQTGTRSSTGMSTYECKHDLKYIRVQVIV